jgi:hypothetical protein
MPFRLALNASLCKTLFLQKGWMWPPNIPASQQGPAAIRSRIGWCLNPPSPLAKFSVTIKGSNEEGTFNDSGRRRNHGWPARFRSAC